MENLDKHKKRFLDGEITALEYEKIVSDLDKEIENKDTKTPNNDNIIAITTNEDKSYQGKVAIFIAISCLILFIISISKPKPTISDNLENNDNTNTTTVKTERQKITEDSIYKIESKKRIKIELAEEAAFMKTKAGKIRKKHPEWSREDCEKLAEGSIWIGMDIQMLKYKRRLPNSANPSNYGGGVTQWQWCWDGWTPSCFYDNDGDGKIDSYN